MVHFSDDGVLKISGDITPFISIAQMEEIRDFANYYLIANTSDKEIERQSELDLEKLRKRLEQESRYSKANSKKGNMPDSGYVYLVRDTIRDVYKIGFTGDVNSRMRQIRTYNAGVVLSNFFKARPADEIALHEMFNISNVSGEWFKLSESDIEEIENYFKLIQAPF